MVRQRQRYKGEGCGQLRADLVVESRGNFLAMERVYDHNNVNTMDQMAPKSPQSQAAPLFTLLSAYAAPFVVNLVLYIIIM